MAAGEKVLDRGGGGRGGDAPAPSLRNGLLIVLAVAATIWLLRAAAVVAMPVAFALLIALGVWPVSRAVRAGVPRSFGWLGSLAAILVVIAFVALFLAGLSLVGWQVVDLVGELAPRLQAKLQGGGLPIPTGGGQASPLDSMLREVGSWGLTALNTVWQALAGIILILFLVLLMVGEADSWKAKAAAISQGKRTDKWTQVAASVGVKFRTFFLTRLMLGIITAALYAAWLALFGVDYLLLWATLAVLLNFIPTVGSLVAGTLPVLYAFVLKDVGTAAAIAGGLLVIEQIMGNFVDPKLMGRQLSLSPLVVLIALIFWSWLWGLPGAFLSVPLTVFLAIVFAHVDALQPVALLLGDKDPQSERN